jgi:serine protease inhibitor
MKQKFFLPLVLVAFVLNSCDWLKNDDEPIVPELMTKSETMVSSNNSFGLNLFGSILNDDPQNKNLMISPLSVSQALSMALNGALDSTYIQMANMLDFDNLTLEDINPLNQNLTDYLVKIDPKTTLNISNSVWNRSDFVLKTPFVDNNKTWYNATLSQWNADEPEKGKEAINSWVKDKTKGKIEKIIDQISDDNVLFLINAVYFKGEWSSKFDKNKTVNKPFTPENQAAKNVVTMIGDVNMRIQYHNDFMLVQLPYGNQKFAMTIFVPSEENTCASIYPQIKAIDFTEIADIPLTKRELWLPKFEFSYEKALNNPLMSLGMTDAFNPSKANFRNISDIQIFISRVMHKTYIKTDEEGSEAAAVTSVEFEVTSVGPNEHIAIDRSFLFAITEVGSGSILFLGKVHDAALKE